MTLAVILSLCIFSSGPATAGKRAWTQSAQEPAQEKPADSSAPASQSTSAPQVETPPAAKNPASASPPAPKTAPAATKPKYRSKAKNPAPCNASAGAKAAPNGGHSDPGTAATSGSGSVSGRSSGSFPGSGSASTSTSADLPPCAPPKVVIRNGGTAEGTVQLTGGTTTAKNSPQRANTERLLAATEAELNTTAKRQLDSAQQETVKQIRQYTAQSKAALDAGEIELAHNLAMKAHLLADQLVKPQP